MMTQKFKLLTHEFSQSFDGGISADHDFQDGLDVVLHCVEFGPDVGLLSLQVVHIVVHVFQRDFVPNQTLHLLFGRNQLLHRLDRVLAQEKRFFVASSHTVNLSV